MPPLKIIAILFLLALITRSAGAGELDGFYVADADFRMMDEGLIIPIVEYVEITDIPEGKAHLEVGYVHLVGDPEWFVGFFITHELGQGVDLESLGTIDLQRLRRMTVVGTVAVGEDQLVWLADSFTPTLHEPSRMDHLVGEGVHVSPFQAATEAAAGTSGPATLAYTLRGTSLEVIWAGGQPSVYRRMDPEALRITGLLAQHGNTSYARNRACLMRIAETIVAGQAYAFSSQSIAVVEALIGDDEAKQERWREILARGPGSLLNRYVAAAQEASGHIGRFMQAAIEREGGLAAYAALSADYALSPETQQHLRLINGAHYFDYDYTDLDTLPFDSFPEFLEGQVAQFEADPWSMTGPWINAFSGSGWVGPLFFLVQEECEG